MRHQCKRHQLSRPADQRKALLRTLATSLFTYGEIKTTMARAKALRPYAEKAITFGKKGDVHSRRLAKNLIYDNALEGSLTVDGKEVELTVLRKLFAEIAPQYTERNGGYIRILRMPPRRGDNSEMALIQLV
jgi:large subunit ribosomal protein L17